MKKFINDPRNLVEELLDGLVLAFPGKVRLAGGSIVGRAVPNSPWWKSGYVRRKDDVIHRAAG